MSKKQTSTAGRGDPYWYEWLVGVAEVVGLLDPDSDLLSVTFQMRGIKGWDDVVVRLKDERRRCYQVKHTRVEDNLTFGDLVQRDEDENSLLGSLSKSWKEASLNDGLTTCIVYTNREAGKRASRTDSGVNRPPLLDFVRWLSGALPSANSIDELIPEAAWSAAWNEWRAQLAGSPEEQLAFLRAFEIRTNQGDLEGLVAQVTTAVAAAFGVSVERAAPLVDALHRALRKWTTGDVVVTVEVLCSELALEAEPKDLAPAPPPPAPFFPSRVPAAELLERELAADGAEPVFFLTAEPGAGKTSVLSWLANRRTDTPFIGQVALRFFCFEPIRPETPFISPDASRVRPRDLWFSLLAQLREGLRGRLHELKVPLRNDLLTWQEARSHVLRLASHIGGEQKRPFVIVIDGIDHAARAAQTMPDQIAEFFASLPGPSELNGKSVRLLVAGQPAESYSAQYPDWLVAPNAGIKKVGLGSLTDGDVRALYQASPSRIPVTETNAVVRLIQQFAKGNTLATVFAVAEAERLGSLEDLARRLEERRLADGLSAYYSAIWQHALHGRGETAEAVEDCLVAALSLGRRGVTPEFLADAFSEWRQPSGWWELVLEALGPLLTRGDDGYRVRHNDIRIFLSGKSGSWSPARRRRVAGQLADYYRRPEGDRAAAHLQLLDLLALADRSTEFAQLFTVDWVIEAGAVGVESEQLIRECREAVRGLPHLRDWSCVVSVACAVQTLERLLFERRSGSHASSPHEKVLPPFLPAEASVRPLSNWSAYDLLTLARDAGQLIDSGETDRATALLRRWLDGLDFDHVFSVLPDISSKARFPEGDEQLEQEAITAFEALGKACGRSGWVLPRSQKPAGSDKLVNAAHFIFERGVVAAMLQSPIPQTLEGFFSRYTPRYVAGWESTLRGLARAGHWHLVKDLLSWMDDGDTAWNTRLRAEATAWALRSGAAEQHQVWLNPLSEPKYGIAAKDPSPTDTDESLNPYLGIAYALGWTRLDLDSRDIASGVYGNYDSDNRFDDSRSPTLAVFRASALLGRIERFTTGEHPSEAQDFVTPAQVGEAVRVLWGEGVNGNLRFYARNSAARLANDLAGAGSLIGGLYSAEVLEQAINVATKYPVDARLRGVWNVLNKQGRRDIQKRWLSHWLAPEGEVWKLSHEEVHGTVGSLLPLANEVGETTLAEQASSRLGWLLVGYQGRKEYGFSDVFEWFQLASRQSPMLWRVAGRRLWAACDACAARGGDNRFDDEIRTAVSAAALRCGVTDWWALIQTTLGEDLGGHWHSQTRQYLVEGAVEAIDAGGRFQAADQPLIWSLALALSYWHDEGDNHALRRLRDALLQSTSPASDQKPLRDALARTTRNVSLDRANPDEGRGETAKRDREPEERSSAVSSAAELIRRGQCVPPSTVAAAIRALASGETSDTCDIPALLSSLGVSHYGNWTESDRDVPASLDAIVRAVPDEALWAIVLAIGKRFDQRGDYPVYGVAPNLLTLALARAKAHGLAELVKGLEIQLDMHARWGRSEVDVSGGEAAAA